MKFALDLKLAVGDTEMPVSALIDNLNAHRDSLPDVSELEGELVLTFNGKSKVGTEYSDPALRLVGGWLQKVPWVISGDTETVALRNSEHVYAFVPAGNGVEISFFEGDEAEIEEYVLDPTNVLLEDFAEQSIALGERMIQLVKAIDPELMQTNEDCKDLQRSLDEATTAWHDHQVHQRR